MLLIAVPVAHDDARRLHGDGERLARARLQGAVGDVQPEAVVEAAGERAHVRRRRCAARPRPNPRSVHAAPNERPNLSCLPPLPPLLDLLPTSTPPLYWARDPPGQSFGQHPAPTESNS